jgi:putative acetyltransferase
MEIVVRPLRLGEERVYLEIVSRAISGLAAGCYPPDAIEGWLPRITEETLHELRLNTDGELRLLAEIDGRPVGIGALVPERSELRACYVIPEAARRGCGSAIVLEIERIARDRGLTRLELAGSLNAEPFYLSQGYRVRQRSDVVLRNGHRLACVWMEKELSEGRLGSRKS